MRVTFSMIELRKSAPHLERPLRLPGLSTVFCVGMSQALLALGDDDDAFDGRELTETVAFVDEMSEDEAAEMLRRMKDG